MAADWVAVPRNIEYTISIHRFARVYRRSVGQRRGWSPELLYPFRAHQVTDGDKVMEND